MLPETGRMMHRLFLIGIVAPHAASGFPLTVEALSAQQLAIGMGPSWSPDGQRLAYYSNREGSFGLYWLELASGIETRLTFGDGDELLPRWSPDGERLAFIADDTLGREQVFVMNADGSQLRQLTWLAGRQLDPAWAPDGQSLVFNSDARAVMNCTTSTL
jgi:TolB protein